MSVWTCGLKAFGRKRAEKDMSPENKKRLQEKMLRIAEEFTTGRDKETGDAKYENIKDANWNNMETFEWLWEKYTHKPLDPGEFPHNFSDLRKFELGLGVYNQRVAKPRGWFASKFHVTRSALLNVPELKKFETRLLNETSQFRDFTVETNKLNNNIISNFKQLAKTLGGKFTTIGRMHAGDVKELVRIQKEYDLIVQRLQASPSHSEKIKLSQQLSANRQRVKELYESGSGEAMRILREALVGVDVESIKIDGTGRSLTNQEKTLVRNIQKDYTQIRKRGVVGLIRGLEKIKQMAKEKNIPWADAHIKRINNLIKQIEFQKTVDDNGNLISSKDLQSERDFLKLGFVDGEGLSTGGQVKFSKHYMAQYTLGILKTIKKLESAVEENSSTKSNELMSDLTSFESVINRAKGRNDLINPVYDMDPNFFLRKYTSDIGIFNYRTHVKDNFISASKMIQKEHLDVAKSRGRKDLEEAAQDMITLLKDVYTEVAHIDPTREGVATDLSRIMTGITYFRLMGGNIRSAARNGTQRIHELVEFGTKAVFDARKFYKSESKTENDAKTMLTRQLKKKGLQWFDDATKTTNAFDFITNKDINVSESSRGALQDAYLLEKNIYVDKNGELTIAGGKEGFQALTDPASRVTTKISKTAGALHKVVEDWNRNRTFRAGFALAFQNMASTSDSWKARQILTKDQIAKIKERKGEEYQVVYKDLQDVHGAKTQQVIDKWMENKAGDIAYNSVMDLHFEYAKWNKAKAIKQTDENSKAFGFMKAGLGQFATYRFNMVRLMHKWAKEAGLSIRAGDFKSEEVMRALRFGILQGTISFATAAFRLNLLKLANNDVLQTAEAMWVWLTAKREELFEDEGLSEETKKRLGEVTFDQGGWAFLGPNIGYVLSAAELFTAADMPNQDESVRYVFDEALNKARKDMNQERYEKLVLVNSQMARFFSYTIPMMQGGGSFADALQLELGLFPDKEQKELSRWLWGTEKKKRKKKGKMFRKGQSTYDRQQVINALDYIPTLK